MRNKGPASPSELSGPRAWTDAATKEAGGDRPSDAHLAILSRTVVFCAAIGLMWWARSLFVPIAMAIFLAFTLNPLVTRLQRWRLGKTPAVILVVAFTGSVLLGVLWLSTSQLASLASELPNYSSVLREKVRSAREVVSGGTLLRLRNLSEMLVREWRGDPKATARADKPPAPESSPQEGEAAEETGDESSQWTEYAQGLVGPFLEVVGQVALASILVVFILLKREDLRDRMILLIGHSRLTVTTRALDEAGQRISRFLLMQAIVNGSYGAVLAIGLWLIGLPYALLWGLLAAALRYIPYIGPWAAAVMPVALAVAVFPGWGPSLGVVALIAVLELVSNNVLEPWLYGRSVGLNPTSVLVSAAFWGFLWGPAGMVLSTPIAVCLVVLGKYVPGLRVLHVMLSDDAALHPRDHWYQRALARDEDEGAEVIAGVLEEHSPVEVIDLVLLPGLARANRDLREGLIGASDYDAVLETASRVGEELSDNQAAESEGNAQPLTILACAARDRAEDVAISLLAAVTPPEKWSWRIASPHLLASELIDLAEAEAAAVVLLSSLPPGGGAHARYLCKRLSRDERPGKLLLARWTSDGTDRESFLQVGADAVCTSTAEALSTLARLHAAPREDVA